MPYVGPDAHGVRPIGDIVVRTEGYVWVSSVRRWVGFECRDYNIIAEPQAQTHTTLGDAPCAPGSPMADELTSPDDVVGWSGYATSE